MSTETDITTYINEKYDPLAIYISGSRARNRERPDSDWDLHLVVRDSVTPLSEKYKGISIDIKYIAESKLGSSIIETPYSPAVPFKILYKNEGYETQLNDLENRTIVAFAKGTEEWSKETYEENKNRMQRFLEAINGTVNEDLICFRHTCKFFDLALLYWFGIRNQWPVPIYESIQKYEKEDNAFFVALMSCTKAQSSAERAHACNMIFETLFK